MSLGAHLKIDCDGLGGCRAKIYLNGMEVSQFCEGIELSIRTDDVVRATITLLVDRLDVSTESLAYFKTYIDEQSHGKPK